MKRCARKVFTPFRSIWKSVQKAIEGKMNLVYSLGTDLNGRFKGTDDNYKETTWRSQANAIELADSTNDIHKQSKKLPSSSLYLATHRPETTKLSNTLHIQSNLKSPGETFLNTNKAH